MANTIVCPGCGKEATLAHLQSSRKCAPLVRSFVGLYKRSRRTTVTHAGGRPPTMVDCPRCGTKVSKTDAVRGHVDCTG